MANLIDFDIDALPTRIFDEHEYYQLKSHGIKRHFKVNNDFCFHEKHNVGYDVKKLRNWRSLERRTHQINLQYSQKYTAFWNFCKMIGQELQKRGASEAWVLRGENGLVDTISISGGTSSRSLKDIIAQYVNSSSKFGYQLNEDETNTYYKLLQRYAISRNRYYVFKTAFFLAIETRIKLGLQKRNMELGLAIGQSFNDTIILRNDDRIYVITYKSGEFLWSESNILITPNALIIHVINH